jgi:hypothetical protein
MSKQLSNKVTVFAEKIRASWQKAVESILETAHHLKEADKNLTDIEWVQLMGQLPFNQSASSKLLAIAEDNRLNSKKNIEILPPHWTTLYEISTLDDKQFKSGVQDGLISPRMKRKDVIAFKSTQLPTIASPTKASKTPPTNLAKIIIPSNFNTSGLGDLRKSLSALGDKFGVEIAFDTSKSGIIARERSELAERMEIELQKRTMKYNKGVSDEDIETIEDTYFQLRNSKQYHPDKKTGLFVLEDIRNAKHPFHKYTSKDLYDYCRAKEIITRFTPVRVFDKEAHVLTLILQHSVGDAKKRADAKVKLERLVKRGNDTSKRNAKKALEALIEFA